MNVVAAHFDRNRTHRRESQLGVKTARDVEEEEKRAFIAKQMDFYQQKQKLFVVLYFTRRIFVFIDNCREENDTALAQQLQKEMKIPLNSIDQTHYHSSDDQV